MNTQQVIDVINRLPIKNCIIDNENTDRLISETAEIVAPMLEAAGLRIVKGGTSPSTTKSYSRIYLEPVDNTTHDARHGDYRVIRVWEWQTRSKGGFSLISHSEIRKFCRELKSSVADYVAGDPYAVAETRAEMEHCIESVQSSIQKQ